MTIRASDDGLVDAGGDVIGGGFVTGGAGNGKCAYVVVGMSGGQIIVTIRAGQRAVNGSFERGGVHEQRDVSPGGIGLGERFV